MKALYYRTHRPMRYFARGVLTGLMVCAVVLLCAVSALVGAVALTVVCWRATDIADER